MSTKPKNLRIRAVLDRLAERFPNAFVPLDNRMVPRLLAIGIRDRIAAACPDIPLRELRSAMAMYCTRRRYRSALVLGAERVDLQGNVVDTVGADEFAAVKALHRAEKAARREVLPDVSVPTPEVTAFSEAPSSLETPKPKLSSSRRQEARRPVVVEVIKRRRFAGPMR